MSSFIKFLLALFARDALISFFRSWQQRRNPPVERSVSPGIPIDNNVSDKIKLLGEPQTFHPNQITDSSSTESDNADPKIEIKILTDHDRND